MAALTIRIPRLRHLRRAVEALAPRNRRRRLARWADDRSTDLDATGAGQAFTADFANDEIDIAAHGHVAGDGPFEVSNAGGDLPAGLVAGTLYWVSAPTAGTLGLHLSRVDALNGANPVSITDAGSGTHTLTPSTADQAMIEHARQGVSTDRLNASTDIDDFI